MNEKNDVLKKLKIFRVPNGGIGNWLSENTNNEIFSRLSKIEEEPLSKTQFNQLLTLGHQAPVTDGFFKYYWLSVPDMHPYDVTKLPEYRDNWQELDSIESLDHLSWGLYRLYSDGLIWFGNIRAAYRELRTKDLDYLEKFFSGKRFDTDAIEHRGPALELSAIAKDNRYLISEMACKSYGDSPDSSDLKDVLLNSYRNLSKNGRRSIRIRELIEQSNSDNHASRQQEFELAMDDVLEESVESEEELLEKFQKIAENFFRVREVGSEKYKILPFNGRGVRCICGN